MQVPRTGAWWDKEYFKRAEILRRYGVEATYIMQSTFSTHFAEVCFHSAKRVQYVPVNGYLFPVKMFDEEIG